MNIVRISAGLGNQMFQYAFYRALKELNPDTKMDISEFKYRKHHYGYELEKIFNIIPDYATKRECEQLADFSKDIYSVIRRKVFKKELKTTGEIINEGEIGTFFQQEMFNKDNAYFVGYWQTEKYFISIKELILKEFSFKNALDIENQKIINQILKCNSVSIHVRRGDYIKQRRYDSIGSVCSIEYYQRAIDFINEKVSDPYFFIFSDDMEWVKANLQISNAKYIDINKANNSYKDMQLMSLCKHNIIANSSFSWWAAWLNNNPEKIVLAPEIWFRNTEMPDIIPSDWIRRKT